MTSPEPILTPDQEADFRRDGTVVVPGFYDLATEIEPIQRAAYDIIGLVIQKTRLTISRPCFHPAAFDAGYQELIAADRQLGAEVYDAVKQIPAFVRLAASPKHDRLFGQLRRGSNPGFAAGGSGIRIDNPNEDRFRSHWHQDYPTQLRSPDGLVFWSTLVPISPDMGPVQIALGSHGEGPVPVRTKNPHEPDKAGAYALTIADEEARLARYRLAAPLTGPETSSCWTTWSCTPPGPTAGRARAGRCRCATSTSAIRSACAAAGADRSRAARSCAPCTPSWCWTDPLEGWSRCPTRARSAPGPSPPRSIVRTWG